MVQINVNTDRLEALSRELDLLKFEFEGIEDRVDDHRDAVGRSGRLMDALDDVTANWSDRRGDVVARLEAFSGLALHAARHYRERERQLANGLRGG